MPAPAMTDDGEALHKLVQNISHAWRSGRTDDLYRYFHLTDSKTSGAS